MLTYPHVSRHHHQHKTNARLLRLSFEALLLYTGLVVDLDPNAANASGLCANLCHRQALMRLLTAFRAHRRRVPKTRELLSLAHLVLESDGPPSVGFRL